MMKTIYTTLGVLALGLAFSGCIKETMPAGSTQTKEQVAKSSFALDGILRGLPASMLRYDTAGYDTAYEDHFDYGISAIHLATEFMINDLATMGDNPYYNRYAIWNMNQGQDARYIYCAYFWDCYYTWIKIANDVINVINEGSATSEQKITLGKAYAYRADLYLDLARMMEAKPVSDKYAVAHGYSVPESILDLTVPIITEKTTETEAKNNPRAKKDVMYALILSDLDKADTLLDGATYNYTQPSIAAVYGLKARTYLEMGYWTSGNEGAFENAAKYAELAISTSGKKPLTKSQWQDPTTGFNSGTSNSAWIWGQVLTAENQRKFESFTSHISAEATWGYARLSKIGIDRKFYESISDSDFRKASWLSPEYIENPASEEFNGVYKFAGSADDQKKFLASVAIPYISIKFRPAGGNVNDYTIGNCADHCLMRVEEMYFIEAEAKAHTEGLGVGKELLETFVKTYRDPKFVCGANSLKDFLVDDLLHQKRIEFWGEGLLFYDYKRLDAGLERGYAGTNHASVFRLNCEGRSPQWNVVITRGEFQSNTGINDDTNNPDPSDKIELWTE